MNQTINGLRPGDELVFASNTTYYLVGGIIATNISDVVLHFDGTLIFTDNTETWPRTVGGQVLECLHFENARNVTFTSQTTGVLDGQGEAWWGLIGYYDYLENRPRLLSMASSFDILIENMLFKNSPYWTVWIYDVDGLEIRYSEVSNRRNDYDGHDFYNLWYVPERSFLNSNTLALSILMDSMSPATTSGFTTALSGIKTTASLSKMALPTCSSSESTLAALVSLSAQLVALSSKTSLSAIAICIKPTKESTSNSVALDSFKTFSTKTSIWTLPNNGRYGLVLLNKPIL